MPLLHGETLAGRLARAGLLPPHEVARLGEQVALRSLATAASPREFGDEGLAHLHHLRNLTELDLTRVQGVTSEGVKRLKASLPGCRVVGLPREKE